MTGMGLLEQIGRQVPDTPRCVAILRRHKYLIPSWLRYTEVDDGNSATLSLVGVRRHHQSRLAKAGTYLLVLCVTQSMIDCNGCMLSLAYLMGAEAADKQVSDR